MAGVDNKWGIGKPLGGAERSAVVYKSVIQGVANARAAKEAKKAAQIAEGTYVAPPAPPAPFATSEGWNHMARTYKVHTPITREGYYV